MNVPYATRPSTTTTQSTTISGHCTDDVTRIADILKKAAGVELPEVYFRSAIETNLLDEDL